MSKNVGAVDRMIRLIIGVVLIALVFIGPKTEWGWLGLIFFVTGFAGFCPLYLPFKINTNK